MKNSVIALAVSVVLVGTRAQSGDAKRLTPSDLVGVYQITAGEHGGKEIPAKEIEADWITFTEDAITVVDRNTKKVYAATYKLDSGKSPARLHMVSIEPKKGEAAEGLIKRDGNTVTVIYALPGGAAPMDFKTHEKQQMFTLKKVAK